MTDFTTELRHAAEADIGAARHAALRARAMHSRAELMRHMMLTTAKSTDKSREESIRLVTDEWLDAWRRDRTNYPYVALMEALSGACFDALTSTDAANRPRRARGLRRARRRMRLARHHARRRDGVAVGVLPPMVGRRAPGADLPEYRERARRSESLWERGCPPECLG